MSWVILEFSQRSPTSKTVEALLTTITQQGIPLKHIQAQANHTIQVQIALTHYYKLRPLFRESGCTWRIKKRKGFAFLPNRIRNRLFFFVGAMLFLTSIFVLSSVVWQVDVDGDTKLNHVFIKAVAKSNGLYVGQWKQRVSAPEEIAKKMEAQLPEVAWIGVNYIGTKIRIHVMDRTIPDKPIVKPPQHITATNDAVITEIRALKGTPVVRPNDRVIRGMILISGMVGDEAHAIFVPAEGTVRGIVWYMQSIVLPLQTTEERLTGRYLDQTYIRLFGRDWKLKGFNQKEFKHRQTIRENVHFHFLGFRIETPIVKQRIWQTEHTIRKRSIAQARAEAIRLAGQNLLRKLDKNAVIRERKLLHENVSGGKVYIKVHVEVEQAITKETEIIDRSING